MHTTRNRLAQTSRNGRRSAGPREDQPFLLRQSAPPPGFPADLIVPPHRGAVITAAAWPVVTPPAPVPPGLSRKAAKKAARRAAARERAQHLSPPDAPLSAVRTETECTPARTQPPEPDRTLQRPTPVEAGPDQAAPLPAARALVPRRQGFVDVLAFVLRDSGRRLARWSSARRRADDMKDKLAKAEARMRAMEAQLAALQALQERVRQS